MKLNNTIFCIVFFLSFAFNLKAQQQDDSDKEIRDYREKLREQLEKQRKEMEELLGRGDPFGSFDKYFDTMLKNFRMNMQDVDKLLEDYDFDSFGSLKRGADGELFEWSENDKERIVLIKVKPDSEKPFDLKIERGMIRLTGQTMETKEYKDQAGNVTKAQSLRRFNHEVPVPRDVDENSAKFENSKEGFVRIRFQKKSLSTLTPKKDLDSRPLRPDKDDLTI